MARIAGQPDKTTLRFTTTQVQLARQHKEHSFGPIWGELNVLLYGTPHAPQEEHWHEIRANDTEHYWVSDLGHFAVWREGPADIWQRNQYLQAVVYFEGRRRPRAIHTLVAKHFCQWSRGDTLVRHLNSNPLDNHANNLQPGCPSENLFDRYQKGRGVVPEVVPPESEVWRLSDSYAGVRVSNLGRVTLGWWVAFNTNGYKYKQGNRAGTRKHVSVKITLRDKARYELLHRLVYEAFVGVIPPAAQVRHWNDNPHDNRVQNLELGTPAQNVRDRIRNGHQRYGEKHPNSKYSDRQRRLFLDFVDSGSTICAAAACAGIGVQTGYQIMRRLRNGLPVQIEKEGLHFRGPMTANFCGQGSA